MPLISHTIGYPRIGPQRQMKVALEKFWKGQSSQEELLAARNSVEAGAWKDQRDAGVNLVAADGTLYDQVLDTIWALGVIPARFKHLFGLEQYFAMARGAPGATALDMSKFLDTNYHFMVPELQEGWAVQPDFSSLLDRVTRCQSVVGKAAAVPIVIGPLTFACLARSTGPAETTLSVVQKLLPAYVQLIKELQALQVPEIQMHEPWLATSKAASLQQEASLVYTELAAHGIPINLTTYFDDLGDAYPWVIKLPVAAITLDFLGVPGAAVPNQSLQLVRQHGFPADKRLGAGVIDGRSVWADTGIAGAIVGELLSMGLHVAVTTSASLQLLPLDVNAETRLPDQLKARLAFARQKLQEIVRTAASAAPGGSCDLDVHLPKDLSFNIEESHFNRPLSYDKRRELQIQLHAFPTSTIGSFPQTAEVRCLRLDYRKGRITQAQYDEGIAAQIGLAIGVQEALGLDVLVHGEAERTDMVEFFGQHLEGMAFTEHGWVQSYGSRYVRPPLIVGDIKFIQPMTTKEFQVAQQLTQLPVKGMLTGPVTIINWSFPRRDITRRAQALQLGLALREEVAALEQVGCKIVQVDDPAIREGLPLKQSRWDSYLTWAVDAFRLCCGVAAPTTQVVTHLCYSDFEDILSAIDRMDADVLTIENSRSNNEMILALAGAAYGRDLGPGVYDVHSPVVPSVDFFKDKIRSFLETGVLNGRLDRIWINPDCGLKTRGWPETIASLRNMVQAAREMRAEVGGEQPAAVAGTPAPAAAHRHGAACCC